MSVSRLVYFELLALDARVVFLAGSFNAWDVSATQMGLVPDGRWVTALSLAPGRYEYLFVVDGRWTPDPQANDYVPNPFGGRNAVLEVSTSS